MKGGTEKVVKKHRESGWILTAKGGRLQCKARGAETRNPRRLLIRNVDQPHKELEKAKMPALKRTRVKGSLKGGVGFPRVKGGRALAYRKRRLRVQKTEWKPLGSGNRDDRGFGQEDC